MGDYYIEIRATPRELSLICAALDSHVYWQLSDPDFRDGGYVDGPGWYDPESVEEIEACNKLDDRLGKHEPRV